jgi:phosphotriesterase-related protein
VAQLITTLGPKNADELGMILPHEHVFVDIRTWDQPGYAQADAADVLRLMAPEIEKAQALGITAQWWSAAPWAWGGGPIS